MSRDFAQQGQTALMIASRHGHTSVVDELLAASIPAVISLADYDGRTALHHACSAGSAECALTLLAHGGSEIATIKDMKGHTAIDCAFIGGHDEVYAVICECTSIQLPERPLPVRQVPSEPDSVAIKIEWDAVSGSDSYKVQRAARRAEGEVSWNTVQREHMHTSWTDHTVKVGSIYVYRVAAVNKYGHGAFSRPSSFMRVTDDRSALESFSSPLREAGEKLSGATLAASSASQSKITTQRTKNAATDDSLGKSTRSSASGSTQPPSSVQAQAQIQAEAQAQAQSQYAISLASNLQVELAETRQQLKQAKNIVKQFGLPFKYVKNLSLLELQQVQQALLVAARRISDERVKRTVAQSSGKQKECVICLGETKTIVLLPCKHLCLCSSCAKVFFERIPEQAGASTAACPVCREAVTAHMQIYR